MLPKSRKISDRKVFSQIYGSGKKVYGKFVSLFLLPWSGPSRFACVVSRQVSKRAVARNKLRRRSYSVIQNSLGGIRDGYATIFLFKSGAAELSYEELSAMIAGLLKKSGLLP